VVVWQEWVLPILYTIFQRLLDCTLVTGTLCLSAFLIQLHENEKQRERPHLAAEEEAGSTEAREDVVGEQTAEEAEAEVDREVDRDRDREEEDEQNNSEAEEDYEEIEAIRRFRSSQKGGKSSNNIRDESLTSLGSSSVVSSSSVDSPGTPPAATAATAAAPLANSGGSGNNSSGERQRFRNYDKGLLVEKSKISCK
jgi:hypothetical protein